MFKRQQLPSDSQLSNNQLANILVAQAVEQLQQITQLSENQCQQLIKQQFTDSASQFNIISHQESDFIIGLFA
ncbi:hypothetical protein HII17_10365 [Thalassotalea sp. M1531]|uniref:Uncharacterized protein n=1 Tax=Thalassotalea algicola TaxID=2716224 RepID=A0A7Y0Q7A0_9GAMM|nr:hypothetical protein [Thalassotalea algicola]NMP31971.1 hypothetical protein [Thalassotalea algicola]